MTTFDEPVGFAAWLGRQHTIAGATVPRAGTARRAVLAAAYRALTDHGIDIPAQTRGLETTHLERPLVALWALQPAGPARHAVTTAVRNALLEHADSVPDDEHAIATAWQQLADDAPDLDAAA